MERLLHNLWRAGLPSLVPTWACVVHVHPVNSTEERVPYSQRATERQGPRPRDPWGRGPMLIDRTSLLLLQSLFVDGAASRFLYQPTLVLLYYYLSLRKILWQRGYIFFPSVRKKKIITCTTDYFCIVKNATVGYSHANNRTERIDEYDVIFKCVCTSNWKLWTTNLNSTHVLSMS